VSAGQERQSVDQGLDPGWAPTPWIWSETGRQVRNLCLSFSKLPQFGSIPCIAPNRFPGWGLTSMGDAVGEHPGHLDVGAYTGDDEDLAPWREAGSRIEMLRRHPGVAPHESAAVCGHVAEERVEDQAPEAAPAGIGICRHPPDAPAVAPLGLPRRGTPEDGAHRHDGGVSRETDRNVGGARVVVGRVLRGLDRLVRSEHGTTKGRYHLGINELDGHGALVHRWRR
jgi:hypothetical protein